MPIRPVLLAAAIALAVSTPAGADVTVRAAPPANVPPQDFRSASEQAGTYRELGRHLERRAERRLPTGAKLSVELVRISPAGRFEPFLFGATGVRVLSDVTPPRIKLRYALDYRGRHAARGEETLSDMNYLWDPAARASSDRLAYEKALIDDWLRKLVRDELPEAR